MGGEDDPKRIAGLATPASLVTVVRRADVLSETDRSSGP
jgi:hypothetical protein